MNFNRTRLHSRNPITIAGHSGFVRIRNLSSPFGFPPWSGGLEDHPHRCPAVRFFMRFSFAIPPFAGYLAIIPDMEARCKNCKWWDSENSSLRNNDTFACTNPKLGEYCDVRERLGADYESASDTLEYEYNEGGSIFTGPDFGCVHFEAKELSHA